ncbi:MAG: gamma-glutamyltransferase [Nitrospirota bacterium]|nr:gamma-glutamyltransferase [Nitrospirota bacterium]MDH5575318.1 gamma-glutamyltransferase [Nitrospirota bacterium]
MMTSKIQYVNNTPYWALASKTCLAWMVLCCALVSMVPDAVFAQDTPIVSHKEIFHPVFAERGMVVSQEAMATRVGVEILKAGGNAIDAAVGVGFALAVTLPQAGNLGGGGFMLIYNARKDAAMALDYREVAPATSRPQMFQEDGTVDQLRLRYSHQSVGVPGTVAGLVEALESHGTLSLPEVVAPAIRLAREGIIVSPELAVAIQEKAKHLSQWPSTRRIFFRPDGTTYRSGDRLIQKDLAWSLQQISEQGPGAFYEGPIAERVTAEMRAHGGLISQEDLRRYRAVWRKPVRGTYRGYEILSMPPPSSGGVHLIQMLNILEHESLQVFGHNSARTIHWLVESMKLAYADRSRWLGDPEFVEVPVQGLISKDYAKHLHALIDPQKARPSSDIRPSNPLPYEGLDTTHFSVMDKDGNVVSNTYTINFSFGSGIVAEGTGMLLNNEMDDFVAKPGMPNAYGLMGSTANAIEPGKRPLSSMTPTVVLHKGKPFLATGSPGGSHIITTTLQIILNVIDHGMNLASATAAPRIHHQWMPDEVRVEPGFSPDTLALLEQQGYTITLQDTMGGAQSILKGTHGLFGASDPRKPDSLAAGY